MQAEKQQRSWKIDVHAKVKNFRFKIKATTVVPTWEFRRCSIFVKLGKYFLRLNSEYGPAIILGREVPKTWRSKFLGFLRKVRFRRRHKNRASHQEENRREFFAYKDLICMDSLVVVALASLFQFVCNKERKGGIIALGSVISLYLALLFKKYIGKRITKFLVLLMVATLVSSLVFDMNHCLEHYGLQLLWNYVVSSGLPGIFQAFANLPWGPG